MKKLVSILVLLTLLLFSSCSSCNKNEPVANEPVQIIPEKFIASNMEEMFINYEKDFVWYTTTVVLKDSLNEAEHFDIESINSIFQIGGDTPEVVIFNYENEVFTTTTLKGRWMECFPLNYSDIELTFKEAYDKLMESNYPKPHSRNITLRKAVGPNVCNPQYIFGNNTYQLFVDALTGEVTDVDPVFGENIDYLQGFKNDYYI